MQLVKTKITLSELTKLSQRMHGDLVKAVVDIDQKIMVVDAAMHADEETLLLKNGSLQENLWGINLYPQFENEDFIEFDSMINIRPRQNNYSRNVEDPVIQQKIRKIVSSLVIP